MSDKHQQPESDAPETPPSSSAESHVPASPPVREEYPGPQETSTGERIDPGATKARPDSPDERRGRRRGAS
jgi:hypothetical protein